MLRGLESGSAKPSLMMARTRANSRSAWRILDHGHSMLEPYAKDPWADFRQLSPEQWERYNQRLIQGANEAREQDLGRGDQLTPEHVALNPSNRVVGREAEMKMLEKTEQSDRAANPNEKPENCYCSALPKGSGLRLPCYTRWLIARAFRITCPSQRREPAWPSW
jgi:hypothetical protein